MARKSGAASLENRNRLALQVAACLILMATHGSACASGTRNERTPRLMYVSNHTKATIQSIRYEPCDVPGSGYTALADSTIEIGYQLSIPIPLIDGCVNMIAVDLRGHTVGEQRSLRAIPGTTWRISE
jgi:hypothetical protein